MTEIPEMLPDSAEVVFEMLHRMRHLDVTVLRYLHAVLVRLGFVEYG